MSVTQEFDSAVKYIQGLPKNGIYQPSTSLKLKFYSLFKQATVGKCGTPQPAFFNAVARAKWNAWNGLGDLDPEEAKRLYVEAYRGVMKHVDALAPAS